MTMDERRTSLYRLDPGYRSPYSVNPQVNLTQQTAPAACACPSPSACATGAASSASEHQRAVPGDAPSGGAPDAPPRGAAGDRGFGCGRSIHRRQHPANRIDGPVGRPALAGATPAAALRRALGVGFSGGLHYSFRSGEDDNDFNNPYLPEWGLARRSTGFGRSSAFDSRAIPDRCTRFSRPSPAPPTRGRCFNFNLRANTGRPYSIRSGRDLNGDQSSRDRPPGVPRNTETGPGRVSLDMTFTKEIRGRERDLARGGGRAARPAGPLSGARLQPAQRHPGARIQRRVVVPAVRSADRVHARPDRAPVDAGRFLSAAAGPAGVSKRASRWVGSSS